MFCEPRALTFAMRETFPSPEEFMMRRQTSEGILDILLHLTPRQELFLKMHYGLGQHEPHTRREIAEYFAITPWSVRQTETLALWHLRRPCHTKLWKQILYYDGPHPMY